MSGPLGVKEMSFIKNLWQDQGGASAAEYALILAIVGTGIAVAAWGLGGAIGNSMNKAANCVAANATTYSAQCQ